MVEGQGITERFIDALAQLEAGRDVEPLVALYSDDAQIGNSNTPEGFTGPDGARQFWTEYRGTFGEMKSEFRNVITTSERVALEWSTRGNSVSGTAVEYEGVSIIEIAGDTIARFRAYFDPGALGRQIAG